MEEVLLLNRPFSEYSKPPTTVADMLGHLRFTETAAHIAFPRSH